MQFINILKINSETTPIGFPTFLPTTFLTTAFLTKRSEQSWSEVYKKCISDQKFWAKIPWSEVYKNCVSDQIQWSEMTKIFDHYCSLKMLCQIII